MRLGLSTSLTQPSQQTGISLPANQLYSDDEQTEPFYSNDAQTDNFVTGDN